MRTPIVQVDAFTPRPFGGNPAAVCVLDEPREDGWMQDVAREMNLSETAFLWRHDEDWDLRWFTPATEVELCGHATLASAHVLWEDGHLPEDEDARFHTLSGQLTASRKGDWIEMDFPAEPPEEADAPRGLIEALGVEPTYVGRNRFDYIVEVRSEKEVRGLDPDMSRLREVDTRGVMVTAEADHFDFDFVSRFFAPRAGVDEDPVTGSAYCCLGPFWRTRLKQNRFLAHQASARGGIVRVRVDGDRVVLGGQAVTTLRGELLA